MLLLAFGVVLAVLIVCLVFWYKIPESLRGAISIISGGLSVLLFLSCLIMTPIVVSGNTIDNRLKILEEQNAKIEQINMDRVPETFKETELRIYTSNQTKIRNLKEEQANLQTLKWILYFGG